MEANGSNSTIANTCSGKYGNGIIHHEKKVVTAVTIILIPLGDVV